MADTQYLQVQIATLQAQIAALNQQQNAAIDAGNQALVQQIAAQVAALAFQLTNLQEQLAAASATAAVPTASTGQVTKDDGTANSQNPATAPTTVATGANGRIDPANVESGTAAPVRTLQQTQGTSNYTAPNTLPAEQAGPPVLA